MDFRNAQSVAKKLAQKLNSERWYRGVGLRVKAGEVWVEVSVDPMCKNLASEQIQEVVDGVKVVVL